MIKKDRHLAILNLIQEFEICTQEDLTSALIEKGYNVSQSTVSRDINELNLVKVEGENKKSRYVCIVSSKKEIEPQRLNLLKQIVVSVESASNLVVVKTLAGNASAAGMVIDELNFPNVLGCVAGDDAILIVAKSDSDAEIVCKSLRNI